MVTIQQSYLFALVVDGKHIRYFKLTQYVDFERVPSRGARTVRAFANVISGEFPRNVPIDDLGAFNVRTAVRHTFVLKNRRRKKF